jgi:hypothetical protein
VQDSTIANNSAGDGPGSGILSRGNAANSTTLERVTLTRNTGFGGSGIFVEVTSGGTLHLRGSIIAGNLDGSQLSNCGGVAPISDGGNVSDGTDCGLTATGDQPGIDPTVALAPDTAGETDVYPIATGSPALDRFACSGSDQRDLVRPQGSACDAGAYELDRAPDTALGGDPAGFTFASSEPGVTFECSLVSGSGPPAFTACTSPHSVGTLPAGTYTFSVRAVDTTGNRDPSPASQTFTVAAPPPPPPTPTATPTPKAGETVVVKRVSGKVLVRVPGTTKFIEVDAAEGIPLGSTVDTKKGVIELTSVTKPGGTPQTARFFDGIFKVTQTGTTTDLKLTEPLAACKKPKTAGAAATKPKSRKLWGSGKGKFRTIGQYSAATVRGTKWLVRDSCAGTLTRVTSGVVAVRDNVKRKTILLRSGKRYLARPKP